MGKANSNVANIFKRFPALTFITELGLNKINNGHLIYKFCDKIFQLNSQYIQHNFKLDVTQDSN